MTRQPPLSLEEQEFVDRKVKRMGSTKLASYLFWFFFGVYGIHRFYNGAIKTGVALLAMHLIGVIILISAAISIMASGIVFPHLKNTLNALKTTLMTIRKYAKKSTKKNLKANSGRIGGKTALTFLS